jgi:hypothetical protein
VDTVAEWVPTCTHSIFCRRELTMIRRYLAKGLTGLGTTSALMAHRMFRKVSEWIFPLVRTLGISESGPTGALIPELQ